MMVENLKDLTRNESLMLRKLNDNYYLLVESEAYEANEIGASIVNAVGRDLSISELCMKIAKKYSYDDVEQIKADVENYINFLLGEGLLIHE